MIMKGVSEIIAIILILMIVVALAALAYTWFSGIFSSLTATTSNATTSTTSAMTTNFRIEIAKNVTPGYCYNATVTIRCLGNTPIDVTAMSAYINDVTSKITNTTGGAGNLNTALGYGGVATFYVTNLTPVAMCNTTGSRLRLIVASGLEQSIIIT
jgi:flagellin-like protein